MIAIPLIDTHKTDDSRSFYAFLKGETFWVGFVRKIYVPTSPKETWHMAGYVSVDKKDWHEADRLKDLVTKHRVTFESVGAPAYHIPMTVLQNFNGTDHNFWLGIDYFQIPNQPTEDEVAERLLALLGDIYV